MKKILLTLLAGILLFGIEACNCGDGFYWTPEPDAPQIQGFVYYPDGTPAVNAKITVSVNGETLTATTDGKGYYYLQEVPAGKGTATVTVDNDPNVTGSTRPIVLAYDKIENCNFTLVPVNNVTNVVDNGNGQIYSIALPDIMQQDSTIQQLALFYMNFGSLFGGDRLILKAGYALEIGTTDGIPEEVDGYYYSGYDIMITINSSTLFGAHKSDSLFRIELQELVSPSSVTHNGVPVSTITDSTDVHNLKEYFYTNEFGVTVFRYPIYLKITENQRVQLTMTPSVFEGTGHTQKIVSGYTQKVGVEFMYELHTPSFLKNYAALYLGLAFLMECDLTYIGWKNIPKGEALILEGYQNYTIYEFMCGWSKFTAIGWEDVDFVKKDRIHTGGSN